MKRTPNIHSILNTVCLVVVLVFNGCSIFGPVGHAISQGYENSISYFNGYYNAKWLFDEAEDEIRSDALAKRGQQIQPGSENQISSGAKDKLLKVIDKCSNILTFHSTSTLVDDALLLIGKSFYYQTDYLKAERKFAELIAQYPYSPLVLETQIWYARTEEKLKKNESGIRMCESTISIAAVNGDNEIEMQAHQIMGRLYLQEKQIDKAVLEFEKVIVLSNDDKTKAEAQMELGSIYFSGKQYEKAAETYLRVGDYTSDIYLNSCSKMQAAIAYREVKEFPKGLTLVDALIENFRYKAYLPNLLFERANNYAASGKKKEAIDEYVYIDTTYAKSEYGLHSAYKLGVMYEKEVGDYQLALKYYTEVNSAPGTTFTVDGRLKYTALTRYYDARKRLEIADSLLFAFTDTTHKTISDSLHTMLFDTTKRTGGQMYAPSTSDTTILKIETGTSQLAKSRADSLKILRSFLDSTQRTIAQASSRRSRLGADSLTILTSIADSIQQRISLISSRLAVTGADSLSLSNAQTASQPVRISTDSLIVLKSIAAQDLGDIFYTEVVVPDSAFFWYEKSLAWNYSPLRSPRILYILAELSRTNIEKKYSTPEEYYARLIRDFPESVYAEEARRFLGKESYVKKVDEAAIYYEQAEKQIDAKQHKNAIKTLRSIAQSYPKSPFAAKSEYAIGWILENHLAQPDSAFVQYKHIVKNYNGTKYASAAANRSARMIQSDSVKSDTAKTSNAKMETLKNRSPMIDSAKKYGMNIDTVINNKGKIDTLKIVKRDTAISNGVKVDTSNMKTIKIDTIKVNSSRVNQKSPSPAGTRRDSVVSKKRLLE